MLKNICAFILSHSGLPWILGINFFSGHLPQKDRKGNILDERVMVILERTPGGTDGYLPDYMDKMIQVWNRARTYDEAAADAMEIYWILHGSTGWDLGGLVSGDNPYLLICDAMGTPAPINNPGEKGLYEFSTNYLMRIENP